MTDNNVIEDALKDWLSCARFAKLLGWKATVFDGVQPSRSCVRLESGCMFIDMGARGAQLWHFNPDSDEQRPDYYSENPADVAQWIARHAPVADPEWGDEFGRVQTYTFA